MDLVHSLVVKVGEEENEVVLVVVAVFSKIRREHSSMHVPKMVSSNETKVVERKPRISYWYAVNRSSNPWFSNSKHSSLVRKDHHMEVRNEKINYLVSYSIAVDYRSVIT